VRAYLMFFARWDQGGPWNSRGIEGSSRWLKRVWNLYMEPAEGGEANPEVVTALRRKLHQTLKQVTANFEAVQFNTIVAALMELLNEVYEARAQGAASAPVWSELKDVYVRMLAPIAPHLAEELWHELGHEDSIHRQSWPEVDEDAARNDEITLIVQVNGKLRDRVSVPVGLGDDDLKQRALATEGAQRFTEGLTIRKVVVVPGRLVNIVAS
jgi:leucyl-tRNA synthetase